MTKVVQVKIFFSVLCLLFVNSLVFSQGINDPHFDAVKHADERTAWMKKALSMDTAQEKKVSLINREIYARYKGDKDMHPIKSKILNDDLKNLESERDERFEEILTEGQMDIYKKEKAHHDR